MSLHCEREGAGPGLVLVHGFSQTGRCWGPVATALATRHELRRVDAPGHGGSDAVRADLVETAHLLAEVVGSASYLGYSMGARMALNVALEHPDRVHTLVLVGGTAGIEDDAERAERRRGDAERAARLREEGVAVFLESWLAQPLFAGLPRWARFDDERLRNTADGLASSLELAGTGSMTPRWDDLSRLTMPVLLVAGALDVRYAALAERMAQAIGSNAELTLVPEAGHAAHLEQPDAFVEAVTPFLARLSEGASGGQPDTESK